MTRPLSLRCVTPDDLGRVATLLRQAFAEHSPGLLYSDDVIDFYWRWQWAERGAGVLYEDAGRLLGVAFGGWRSVHRGPHSARAFHLGPLAVHPQGRRHGLGRQLLAALEVQAAGADLLTLVCDPRATVHPIARRRGFQLIARVPRRVALLDGASFARVANVPWAAPALRLLQRRSAPGLFAPAGIIERALSPGAVVEEPLPPLPSQRLASASFARGDAAVRGMIWPVRTRSGHTTGEVQLLRAQGSGAALDACVAALCDWARKQGAIRAFITGAQPPLRGFHSWGAPASLRMARPLTAVGSALLEHAQGWCAWAPEP